jgi:uncharacterized membrane protein YqhA
MYACVSFNYKILKILMHLLRDLVDGRHEVPLMVKMIAIVAQTFISRCA